MVFSSPTFICLFLPLAFGAYHLFAQDDEQCRARRREHRQFK
jgi:hypothetical protein